MAQNMPFHTFILNIELLFLLLYQFECLWLPLYLVGSLENTQFVISDEGQKNVCNVILEENRHAVELQALDKEEFYSRITLQTFFCTSSEITNWVFSSDP